jgi:spoIIIJ-associated protein
VEWVETTGKTVDEAKDRALDLLGVDERDAEFEVLEQPKVGFLGRVKGLARVRARVKPTAPRPKAERRDRRRRGSESGRGGRGRREQPTSGSPTVTATAVDAGDELEPGDADEHDDDAGGESRSGAPRRRRRKRGSGRGPRSAPTETADDETAVAAEEKVGAMPELSLDEQARLVAEFLDGLVAAFGLDATTAWEKTDDENAEVRVEGENLGLLVGPKGHTLQAVSEVARSVVVRHGEGGSSGRVHVDVAGYRQRRREALIRFTNEVADEVRASGVARALEPMNAADRKIVHDAVNELDGVDSTSEGEDPNRRVVIVPA